MGLYSLSKKKFATIYTHFPLCPLLTCASLICQKNKKTTIWCFILTLFLLKLLFSKSMQKLYFLWQSPFLFYGLKYVRVFDHQKKTKMTQNYIPFFFTHDKKKSIFDFCFVIYKTYKTYYPPRKFSLFFVFFEKNRHERNFLPLFFFFWKN